MASQSAQAQMRRDRLLATQKLFEMTGKGGPFPTPDARPGSYGRGQYAAQDRPVVDMANMPGPTLAQGQPQYANLMNIRSRLPRRFLRG
jgi:hypothetical protein